MNRYGMIVFDWDGTLMDSISRIVSCIQATAKAEGYAVPEAEAVKQGIGLDLPTIMSQLFHISVDSARVEQLEQTYRQYYFYDDPTPMALFDGVKPMLAALKDAGYRLAIATGKSRIGLQRGLEETGLTDMFELTMVAEESASKPAPDMLLAIADQTGLLPSQLLMVGDATFDIEMANRAGADAIAVLTGVHKVEQFEPYKPKNVLTVATELPAWLSGV